MTCALNWVLQILSLLRFALWSARARKGSVLTTLLSVAGVVAVFSGTFAIREGFEKVLASSVDPSGAIVLRSGAESELVSILGRNECLVVADRIEVAHRDNKRLASPELFVIISLPTRVGGLEANVPFRGVLDTARWVHSQVRVVSGRWFVPGRHEIIVGKAAAQRYIGLELGSSVRIGKTDWLVVGIFEAGGGVEESEVWTDAHLLQNLYRRGTTFSSVVVLLNSPASLPSFKKKLEEDPRLNVRVLALREYYGEQGRILNLLITRLGGLITLIMLVGALLASVNTMYSAVQARQKELAMLRAIGFSELSILFATIIEAIVLCFTGGVVGGGLVFLLFHGFRTATMNFANFSQVVFAFEVNSRIILSGLTAACFVGLAGGILPAWKAAQVPVAKVLRSV